MFWPRVSCSGLIYRSPQGVLSKTGGGILVFLYERTSLHTIPRQKVEVDDTLKLGNGLQSLSVLAHGYGALPGLELRTRVL